MSFPAPSVSAAPPSAVSVPELRALALRGLARMYRPYEGRFAFRIRRADGQDLLDGTSLRYTAISLIGLAGEDESVKSAVLGAFDAGQVCTLLVRQVAQLE